MHDVQEDHALPEDPYTEMDDWFAVSGDMDDFIYYGDTAKAHSEK